MSDDDNNPLGGGGGGSRSSKEPGIHHANIQNRDRTVSRLRKSFRKVEMPLELEKTGEQITAILVLMEVMPKSCYLFTKKKIAKNSVVTIRFTQPLAIDVKGRTRYSEIVNQGTAVQVEKGEKTFRTLIEFQLTSDLERNAMKDFYQQVRDDNYVATQWHMYISDKMERTRRAKDFKEKNLEVQKKSKSEEKRNEQDRAKEATEEATGRITPPNGAKDESDSDDGEAA